LVTDSNFLKQEENQSSRDRLPLFPKGWGADRIRYRNRYISDNFYEALNQVFYPGPTAVTAARGACARLDATQPVSQANLPADCTLNADTSILLSQTLDLPPRKRFQRLMNTPACSASGPANARWKISFDMELMSADGTLPH
jgi:hypothetical protein